jgi:hypothetical protein
VETSRDDVDDDVVIGGWVRLRKLLIGRRASEICDDSGMHGISN